MKPRSKPMDGIYIQTALGPTVAEMDVEIVERKGLGHPDTICDAVMERVAQALSRAYREKFGTLLHFNCDKGLLVAGRVERRLGGGQVLEPMRLVIGDRATASWKDKHLDVDEIAVETSKAWFRENIPRVDPDRHLRYQVELRPGSEELAGLFLEKKEVLGANDTSAAVGHAPFSDTERLVLAAEHYLNSKDFKARFPETGQDVKVMGIRTGRRLALTVAMPLIDQYVVSEADYFRRKEAVQEALLSYLKGCLGNLEEATVSLNSLDRPGAGTAGMYLSVLGTSAEDADSGEVGRGNQVNGLISLNRPRGSEAAAGKNPASHVGKIYNVLTHLLAHRIHREIPGLRGVEVWLCSRIGDPVDRPQIVSVQIHLQPGITSTKVADPIRQLIQEELARLPVLCEELAQGRHLVY
jgi:S-adenosylmethionine synthetase